MSRTVLLSQCGLSTCADLYRIINSVINDMAMTAPASALSIPLDCDCLPEAHGASLAGMAMFLSKLPFVSVLVCDLTPTSRHADVGIRPNALIEVGLAIQTLRSEQIIMIERDNCLRNSSASVGFKWGSTIRYPSAFDASNSNGVEVFRVQFRDALAKALSRASDNLGDGIDQHWERNALNIWRG